MLFNIERDNGQVIEGYLVPDGFSEQPWIEVFGNEGLLAELPCDRVKISIVEANRHETGLIGFLLDDTVIRDIKDRDFLLIRDKKTKILIYRRAREASLITQKILRLETQLLPQIGIDRELSRHFQYYINSAEHYGDETVQQVFHLDQVKSIYMSGRLLIKNYTSFLNRDFKVFALLQDPYYEMAERLIFFAKHKQLNLDFLATRDRLLLSPLMSYFSEFSFQDEATISKKIKQIPVDYRKLLRSPVVRQLTTADPNGEVSYGSVSAALDLLSRMEFIGTRSKLNDFEAAMSTYFDQDDLGTGASRPNSKIQWLADILSNIPSIQNLLEEDLILFHYCNTALKTVEAQTITKLEST